LRLSSILFVKSGTKGKGETVGNYWRKRVDSNERARGVETSLDKSVLLQKARVRWDPREECWGTDGAKPRGKMTPHLAQNPLIRVCNGEAPTCVPYSVARSVNREKSSKPHGALPNERRCGGTLGPRLVPKSKACQGKKERGNDKNQRPRGEGLDHRNLIKTSKECQHMVVNLTRMISYDRRNTLIKGKISSKQNRITECVK